jgi:diguanylate cyclase (GGDEF)-like protein/PAS domain S-box-containing protein
MPAAIAAAVVLGTLVTALVLYQQAQRDATRRRNAAATHMRQSIYATLDSSLGRLQELASAAGEHWPTSGYEFATLAEGVIHVQGVERVSLLRYLTARERASWERAHVPIVAMQPSRNPSTTAAKLRNGLAASGGEIAATLDEEPARDAAASALPPPYSGTPPPPGAFLPPGSPPPGSPPPGSPPPGSPAQPSQYPPWKRYAPLQTAPTHHARQAGAHPPQLERASAKAHYFVLESFLGRSKEPLPIGANIGASPARAATLLVAGASGRPQASAPIALPSKRATELYVPVYAGGTHRATTRRRLAALRGFIATRYRYATLASGVADSDDAEDVAYSLREGGTTLIASGASLPQPRVLPIEVAGRDFTLAVGTSPAHLASMLDTLSAGGALTVLLLLISRVTARRERFALSLARQRTAERELAQSALVVAENRFKTAFSYAPIGMALISLDGAFMQVNRALARIVGYEEEQLLQRDVTDLVDPDDRREHELALDALRHGAMQTIEGERRLLTADGGVAWTSTHTTLIRDDEQKPAYLLAQIEDVSARRRYESRLQHLADHDPLTGLLNRRAYDSALRAHLESPAGREGAGGVIVLDLDDFKQVNDTLGHSAGDDLIGRVAHALSSRLRSEDVIARLGGDEFAILLRGGGEAELGRLAEELLEIVREQRAARGPGGRERPVTASLGVAPLCLLPNASADEVLTAADLAMYDAKEAGRDRAETYGGHAEGEGRQARIESHLAWVERIRAALDEDRLVLHAQPVAETSTRRMTQYELLIRMRDDDDSLIQPSRFLPIAERYGLIKELDRWVIGAAIALLREQLARGRRPVVELNLSGQSLGDSDLAEHVGRKLEGSGVLATQLIFEVTETAAIGNMAAARSCAEQLHALGCRFALDDFGAGFGSFYYLKHLPFDFIKIDGEFVRNCASNAADRLVVKAVVDLARGLGKRTVAEFVGDATTLRILRDLGVDYAQGFHIGRPAPLNDWLATAEGGAPRPDADALAAEEAEEAAEARAATDVAP